MIKSIPLYRWENWGWGVQQCIQGHPAYMLHSQDAPARSFWALQVLDSAVYRGEASHLLEPSPGPSPPGATSLFPRVWGCLPLWPPWVHSDPGVFPGQLEWGASWSVVLDLDAQSSYTEPRGETMVLGGLWALKSPLAEFTCSWLPRCAPSSFWWPNVFITHPSKGNEWLASNYSLVENQEQIRC